MLILDEIMKVYPSTFLLEMVSSNPLRFTTLRNFNARFAKRLSRKFAAEVILIKSLSGRMISMTKQRRLQMNEEFPWPWRERVFIQLSCVRLPRQKMYANVRLTKWLGLARRDSSARSNIVVFYKSPRPVRLVYSITQQQKREHYLLAALAVLSSDL